jgi:hypothetical protein
MMVRYGVDVSYLNLIGDLMESSPEDYTELEELQWKTFGLRQ